jgi:hypothetical protein
MANATASVGSDPRKRNLAILGAVTAFFFILAILAVIQQARSLAPKFEERPFFPGLAARINDLGAVTITSKSGTFHLQLQQGKWVVVEKNSFPADAGQIRAVAVGMAELTMLEPKTARADWLTYVGLGAPDKGGDAVDVTLADMSGKPMAELVVGHTQGATDALGRQALYVRRPNENQSWLARGALTPKPNAADWLDRNVINIARDRAKGATVTPATGPAYTISRDSKDQQDFKLLDLPAGRSLSFDGSPDGVAGAIVGFNIEDVAKADQFDFSKAPQSVFHTFDGLDVTVKIATKGMDHWATLSAAGMNPATQTEASAINARLNGFAFKLPEMSMEQIVPAREVLLKPPGGPPTAAPPATAARGAPGAPRAR